MNLTIRLYDYVDMDLIELFSNYNVSSSIFIDALYANYYNMQLQYGIPEKRIKVCPRRKRFAFEIKDREISKHVKSIRAGFRSEYIKKVLRKYIKLFLEEFLFDRKPNKDPDIRYVEFPKDVLEKEGRKIRRRCSKHTLYSLLGDTLDCKVTESVTDTKKIVETPAINEVESKSQVSLLKPGNPDENMTPDVSPKTHITLTEAFVEHIESEANKNDPGEILNTFMDIPE